jgi:biotin carboxylase
MKGEKKIAIIGASYLQLPLVLKVREMGYKSICFAWEEGSVCKEICDKFYPVSILDQVKILEICNIEKISAITSISSDLAVPTMSYIADKLGLIGNSIESSLVCTNKYLQRKALYNSNILMPEFENLKNIPEETIKTRFRFPVIIKPVDRSGSKGVVVVKDRDNISNEIEYARKESLCGEVIIEEFIDGEEISVESVSWEGKHNILAYTDKVTTGFPHFVELEHHQPSKFWKSHLHDKILSTVKNSLDTLGVKYGASHSELIITKDGKVYVTEIGARMGGDFIGSNLVMLSTGFDFLKAIIEISLNQKPDINFKCNQNSGVCFYTEKSKWVADFVHLNHADIIDYKLDKLRNEPVNESSQRSGYFIYSGSQKIDSNSLFTDSNRKKQ